jgi:hypothetical protein
VTEPAASKPLRPIRGRLLKAIEAFATGEVKTITDAAALVGMKREAVSRALRRPDVQQTLADRLGLIRSSWGRMHAQAAVLHLVQNAKSDDIRLRASQWLETTLGMGQTSAAGQQAAGGGGQGIVVNVVFSRIDASGGEIRPIGAHLETPNSQTIDALAVSRPDRILAKAEAEPSAATEPRGRR